MIIFLGNHRIITEQKKIDNFHRSDDRRHVFEKIHPNLSAHRWYLQKPESSTMGAFLLIICDHDLYNRNYWQLRRLQVV